MQTVLAVRALEKKEGSTTTYIHIGGQAVHHLNSKVPIATLQFWCTCWSDEFELQVTSFKIRVLLEVYVWHILCEIQDHNLYNDWVIVIWKSPNCYYASLRKNGASRSRNTSELYSHIDALNHLMPVTSH
jgi:hypothetical protein